MSTFRQYSETCCCGASLTYSGDYLGDSALIVWRLDHVHNMVDVVVPVARRVKLPRVSLRVRVLPVSNVKLTSFSVRV